MIAFVKGRVEALTLTSAVVEVGGVGMQVWCTPGTLAALRIGDQGTVHTSLVVREDSLSLYGFASTDERDVFELLQTASGVGPKLAQAMLAVHDPDALRREAPGQWWNTARLTLGYARAAHAVRGHLADCAGAIATAACATAHGVMAARGQWVTNEKTLLERAGLRAVDGVLSGLPFAALVDPASGRFALQRWEIVYRPALTPREERPIPGGAERVLVQALVRQGRNRRHHVRPDRPEDPVRSRPGWHQGRAGSDGPGHPPNRVQGGQDPVGPVLLES